MYHHYFPEELIQLRQELSHHPPLQLILVAQECQDIEIHIAEIAAYCGIVLDGDYSKEDILEICNKCTEVLRQKRAIHVN